MTNNQFVTNVSILAFIIIFYFSFLVNAQTPSPVLVGYWQNWQSTSAPYIPLNQIDSRYNIVNVAFATPQPGTDYKMEFIPDQVSPSIFISQIQTLQTQNKKVLISIGGANATISLDNITERDTFISSILDIINTYGFDGIDLDLENNSLFVTGGTISNPVDQPVINLIYAVKQIMANYYILYNKRLFLTMSPGIISVQGGMLLYNNQWGSYLPVIDALRDSIEILSVQLYNTVFMVGLDGNIYTQGTPDFIISMTEAVLLGFNTPGGIFLGLPASKVAVGLPACINAASGGFTDTASVKSAMKYLLGNGLQPGSYTLLNSSGYSNLRGLMTWSINWDATNNCGGIYEYADNYQNIFGLPTYISKVNIFSNSFHLYPNPIRNFINIYVSELLIPNIIFIYNSHGEIMYSGQFNSSHLIVDFSKFPNGLYFVKLGDMMQKFIKP